MFDFEHGRYSVPFGLGVGKVIKVGKTVFNGFVEAQFTMLNDGAGNPAAQIFMGINTQFLD